MPDIFDAAHKGFEHFQRPLKPLATPVLVLEQRTPEKLYALRIVLAVPGSVLEYDEDGAICGVRYTVLRAPEGESLPIRLDEFPYTERRPNTPLSCVRLTIRFRDEIEMTGLEERLLSKDYEGVVCSTELS